MNNTFFSSIDIQAPLPIDPRFIVETTEDSGMPKTMTDLVSIPNVYPNMFAFVRSEKQFYFLKNGAVGTSLSDWSPLGSNGKFTEWDDETNYVRGSTVYVGSSGELFFISKTSNLNVSPIGNPTDWFQVTSGAGGLVTANFSIPDNSVPLGDASRSFEITYSAIGDYPVVDCWMNIYNGSSVDKVNVRPLLQLDKNAVGVTTNGKLRFTFNGKISDIVSASSGTAITGKITLR